ncbi:hypothetical protein HanRHA438_Chr02g0047781 [Helianthus annuus]|nr:hypothetical protein HanIR_Chr02g0051931 [Helianthus annuus]KAJ0938256.1 hypothetical protein HanRHA438_Chr02g0047781 [Helianthus annuus]
MGFPQSSISRNPFDYTLKSRFCQIKSCPPSLILHSNLTSGLEQECPFLHHTCLDLDL